MNENNNDFNINNLGSRYIQGEKPSFENHDNDTNSNSFSMKSYDEIISQTGQKRKNNTAMIIFITVICVIMLCFLTGLGVYLVSESATANTPSATSSTTPNGGGSIVPTESITEATTTNSKPNTGGIDKNGPQITLKNINTKVKATAQNTYNAVSVSTVDVLCFADKISSRADAVSEGSGIIISKDGYIITNSHVIGDTNTYKIKISTAENEEYEAVIVGYDDRTDLAVLKCKNAKNLSPVEFGKDTTLDIGDDVIAIGNPGGVDFQNSMTKGIVSATNRTLKSSSVEYIQTDAAINPGNSGGPLCNLYGQVIGINTSKISSTDYEGMGFSIPSSTVMRICNELITTGYVSGRVKLGITGTAISEATASNYGVPVGIYIQSIKSDSTFYNTDAKTGDIITKVDGVSIKNFNELYALLDGYKANDTVEITLYRITSYDYSKGETIIVKGKLLADVH